MPSARWRAMTSAAEPAPNITVISIGLPSGNFAAAVCEFCATAVVAKKMTLHHAPTIVRSMGPMPFLLRQDKSDNWSCGKRLDGLVVSSPCQDARLGGVVIIAVAPSLHAGLLNSGM